MNLDFSKPQFTQEKIAYYTFGNEGKTLILVHGSFGSGAMWMRQIPSFIKAGYKIIAVDLQGHGKSQDFDLSQTSMEDYASDIKSVLKTVGGKPILIGHSMSGLTVLTIAAEGLVGQVVAIDPSPSLEVQGEQSIANIPDVYSVVDAGIPQTPEKMMKTMPDIEPEMFPRLSSILGMESGTARRQRKQGLSIPKEKLDTKSVLFLGAELGDSLPFGISAASTQKMAEFYNKEYLQISGASHPGMLVGKHAEEVAQKIITWLQNINFS